MDDILSAIDKRRSRRKYLPAPPEPLAVKTLQTFIDELNSRESLKMRLILNNGDAFNGFSKSYGMLSGVQNYILLIGNPSDAAETEKLGYFGEWLVLHATALGLGTCWVGGTFDRNSCPTEPKEGESIICAITVGNTTPELSGKEKLIRWGTHRKSKTAEQMYTSDAPVPDWFLSGMEAVRKAPSAVNRQPVMFSYENGTVTASVKRIEDASYALDLGIAKLHFQLGAGGGSWQFGNGAAFRKE